MKKLVALLLAAMMVLCAVSALAEEATTAEATTAEAETPASEPSPTKPPKPFVPDTTPVEEAKVFFVLTDLGTAGTEYKANLEAAADQLAVFAAETQDAVKAVVGEKAAVHDMTGIQVANWTKEDGAQVCKVLCPTPYQAGAPVAAVLALVKGEATTEYVLPAAVTAEGVVEITWSEEMMALGMEADEMVLMIVSAAE